MKDDATTTEIKSNKEYYNSENADVEEIFKFLRTENRVHNYDAVLLPVLSPYLFKTVLYHESQHKVIEDRTRINDSSRFL